MKELPFCGTHTNTHTHPHTIYNHSHTLTFTFTLPHSHTLLHIITHIHSHSCSHTHTHSYTHTQSHPFNTHTCCEGWGRHPARTPGPAPSADLGCCQDLLLVQLHSWFPRVSLNSCLVQPFQVEHSTPVGPSPRLSGHSIR